MASVNLGNIIKFLPTGTFFAFQALNAASTNSGDCHTINKYLSGFLLGICGFICFLTCFTDSYSGNIDRVTYYGLVTWKGLWIFWPSLGLPVVELPQYMPNLGDFMHGFLSTAVFAVLGLLETNTVMCFYPQFQTYGRDILQVMPPVILVIGCWVCNWFPSNRHGLGNPPPPITPETE